MNDFAVPHLDPSTQLEHWMEEVEDEHLEFKAANQHFPTDELCKYACAFANGGGGRLILGVTDKRPRRVVGSQAFQNPEKARNIVHDKVHIRTSVELIQHKDGRVVVFEFACHPKGQPADFQGIEYMRKGESLTELSALRRKEIYAETAGDFSTTICQPATLSELSELSEIAIDAFRQRWLAKLDGSKNDANKDRARRIRDQSNADLLENIGATIDGRITYAALILFGSERALTRYLPQAEVIFEYHSSEASGPPQDRLNFREGAFLFLDRLWDKINQRNDRQHYQDGLFVVDLPTFAEQPVRELLLNAITHRDYQVPGSVYVRQYPRKIVCESPGGFMPGINEQNIIERTMPRNRCIAEIFEKCGLVERSGQGIDLMFYTAAKQAKLPPSFAGTDPYQVVVTISGEVQDPGFIRFLEKIGQDKSESFSDNDFRTLDLIRREEPLPDQLKPNAHRLKQLKIVETTGRGRGTRYILSQSLYRAVGKAGHYTRAKGLDREHNLQLLLQHIRESGTQGAPKQDLDQVVPTLTPGQIEYRLNLMRKEGLIALHGKGRGSRWYTPNHLPNTSPQSPL